MFQVSVEESFSAGHALRGYHGKCENVHGHNYKVRIRLQGLSLNSIGLLYDFKEIKESIQAVIRLLDHQFMNEVPPFDEINPSAENIAKYFYDQINPVVAEAKSAHPETHNPHPAPCHVQEVTVWETDTTTATYLGPHT